MLTIQQMQAAQSALEPDEPHPEPKVFRCAWCTDWFIRQGGAVLRVPQPTLTALTSPGICLECLERVKAQLTVSRPKQ